MVRTTKLGRKMREDSKYSFFELSILIFIFSVHQLGAKHTALKLLCLIISFPCSSELFSWLRFFKAFPAVFVLQGFLFWGGGDKNRFYVSFQACLLFFAPTSTIGWGTFFEAGFYVLFRGSLPGSSWNLAQWNSFSDSSSIISERTELFFCHV